MGVGRLCRHRHHAADRRRGPLPRPSTCAPGERVLDVAAGNGNATLAAARRLRRGDVHRLRAARCSTRAARAPSAKASRSSSRRPTPRRCRSPRRSFDVVLSTFGVMFAPDHAARRGRDAARAAGRAAASAWPTGRPRASSAGLFKRGRALRAAARQRPVARRCGARRRTCARLFGGVRGSAPPRAISRSVAGRPSTSWTCSARSTARCTRRSGARRRQQAALSRPCSRCFAKLDRGETAGRWCRPMLEIVITR